MQPETEEYWRSYRNDQGHKVGVSTISNYDALEQIQHYTTIRKYKDQFGTIFDESRTHISLRYVYPKEMERLMDSNGFEIIEVYKDWNETPITGDCSAMIYICKKVRGS